MRLINWLELKRLFYGNYKQILFGSLTCITLAFLFAIQKWYFSSSHILKHPYFKYSLYEEEPLNVDQTCQIPRFHPFDKSIWKYLTLEGRLRCASRQLDLTFIDRYGYLHFNRSEMNRMRYNEDLLSCIYWPILQQPGEDDSYYFGEQQLLKAEGVPIHYDFITVKCYIWNFANIKQQIYEKIYANIRNTTRMNSNLLPTVNVAVFGVDSLSRLAFIRLLPKTYRYLTETMGAFVFRGLMKVGDNTFPNLCALLTGYKLYGSVLPHPPKIKHYDNWPLIWKNYSEEGHATLFAEDLPEFSMFNYLSTGFYRQPTDHYLRPFWLAVRDSSLLRTSSHLCLGQEPRHMLQIRYFIDFISKYSRYFAFSWLAEVTHDYLQRSAVLDDDFYATLRYMHTSGLLNNTLLIFMSDHGHRFSKIRETMQGHLEERLPFVSIIVPESLKHKQKHIVSALHQNVGRLVSPFDMHATLLDLLRFNKHNVDLGNMHFNHGLSLFGPIPSNRTCDEAGVPENFCACGQMFELSADDQRTKRASITLVKHLNDLLQSSKDIGSLCTFLTLGKVKSAHIVVPKKSVLMEGSGNVVEDRQVITVVLETNPGLGMFEGTVVVMGDDITVSGDVSRINMYRGQSDCIQDREVRKYCYCKNLL